MKSATSRSLAPRASCSRIWLRRSTARPAFDSAIDWFWHTRQRSSAARSMTRLSSAASSAPATETASNNANALLESTFIQQGGELVAHQLAGDRADALVADHAALVDDVGLRHAVYAVVDADPAVEIEGREPVRVAKALQPAERIVALILVIQPVQRCRGALRELDQHRMLVAAGDAPRGPYVEDPHLALQIPLGKSLVGLLQHRQLEVRRRLADQRRGNFPRIEPQAERQQHDQGKEYCNDSRDPHAVTSAPRRSRAATR